MTIQAEQIPTHVSFQAPNTQCKWVSLHVHRRTENTCISKTATGEKNHFAAMTELQSVSMKEAQMDNLAVPIQQSKVFLAKEAKQRVTDTPFTNKGTKTYQLATIINGKKKNNAAEIFCCQVNES